MLTLYEHPLSAYAMKAKIGAAGEGTGVPGHRAGWDGDRHRRRGVRGSEPARRDPDVDRRRCESVRFHHHPRIPGRQMAQPAAAAQGSGGASPRAHDRGRDGRPVRTQQLGRHGGHPLQARERSPGRPDGGYAKSNIDQLQHWLDVQLGGKPWFNGDSFGWGDIACAPYINRSAAYGYTPPAGSELADWLLRVNQRPSVAQVIEQMRQVHRQAARLRSPARTGQNQAPIPGSSARVDDRQRRVVGGAGRHREGDDPLQPLAWLSALIRYETVA